MLTVVLGVNVFFVNDALYVRDVRVGVCFLLYHRVQRYHVQRRLSQRELVRVLERQSLELFERFSRWFLDAHAVWELVDRHLGLELNRADGDFGHDWGWLLSLRARRSHLRGIASLRICSRVLCWRLAVLVPTVDPGVALPTQLLELYFLCLSLQERLGCWLHTRRVLFFALWLLLLLLLIRRR